MIFFPVKKSSFKLLYQFDQILKICFDIDYCPQRRTPSSAYSPKKGVCLQNSSSYRSQQGIRLQNSSIYSHPKWGPPLEFINQRRSASRFYQTKECPPLDFITQKEIPSNKKGAFLYGQFLWIQQYLIYDFTKNGNLHLLQKRYHPIVKLLLGYNVIVIV